MFGNLDQSKTIELNRISRTLKSLIVYLIAVLLFTLFFFSRLDPAPVQAFANQSVDLLNANVLASGILYTCGDFHPWWDAPPSAECLEDRACTGVAEQLMPTAAEVETVEDTHHSSRELNSCHRIFSPWLKVLLHDGEEEKVRCASWYGTNANTQYMRMESFDDAKQRLAAYPEGSGLLVWSLPTTEHCLVGVADLTDLASAATSAAMSQRLIVTCIALVPVIAISFALCLKCKEYKDALEIPVPGASRNWLV
jgi:hypothetical protein